MFANSFSSLLGWFKFMLICYSVIDEVKFRDFYSKRIKVIDIIILFKVISKSFF